MRTAGGHHIASYGRRVRPEEETPFAHRLHALHRNTLTIASVAAVNYPPVAVFVEQPPTSKWVTQALGVVQAALHTTLNTTSRLPTSIWTVNNKSWKRDVLGVANVKSAEAKARSLHAVHQLGYAAPDDNHADAINIARHGFNLLQP